MVHWFPGALVTREARPKLRGEALVEVTSYAEPCRTTSPFVCGDKKRYHQEHRPGWSRVYARVVRTGTLAPGMPVRMV